VLRGDAADYADPVDPVDPVEPLRLVERGELGAEDRLTVDPKLIGYRRAGDHVVAGDHPHPDVGRLRVRDRRLGLGAWRVDHADETRHLEALDVRQQVAAGVERHGVEIAVRGRRHA
jgi:hypothetical protein